MPIINRQRTLPDSGQPETPISEMNDEQCLKELERLRPIIDVLEKHMGDNRVAGLKEKADLDLKYEWTHFLTRESGVKDRRLALGTTTRKSLDEITRAMYGRPHRPPPDAPSSRTPPPGSPPFRPDTYQYQYEQS
ncbi:hypothetical protein OCU04_011608 [Sclerotinia nivalis]|uniref:Uncharacterized protein n=1 Tax=Sclerotinia nivalis TaxID=352851 RepID=A0A9X0AC31_9HELO|nr:hypothetical protein OCU04_011608 [Sclerotinia nivalis]